jgi:hypothetical protein
MIWDNESREDHWISNLLKQLEPFPLIFFENKPVNNILCDNWRNEGYSRQQYSNFYNDNYTKNDYIGMVDSDTFFITEITPEDLFINGKPRILGYNGCCTPWIESVNDIIGKKTYN